MSGPKHLWSGDWRSESRQPATAPPPAFEQEPQPEPPENSARFTRQQFAIALGTGVATAAVAITLIVTLGGGHRPSTHHRAANSAKSPASPGQAKTSGGGGLNNTITQSSQTTIPAVNGPSADWMGMQIVTSPSGIVVSTVKLGSTADRFGFEPGDQIQSVNGHILGSVSELAPDTASVQLGAPVTIALMRSSVPLTLASIPMTQRPTIHP